MIMIQTIKPVNKEIYESKKNIFLKLIKPNILSVHLIMQYMRMFFF